MLVDMSALLRNKKATFNYEVVDTYQAGVKLLGHEVKSLKLGRGSFEGSYIIDQGGEMYLKGFTIPPYQPKNTPDDHDPQRLRKLLLKKDEIAEISKKRREAGLTVVPIALYYTRHLLKLEIALVRGKKKFDKRQDIKKRDQERDLGRKLKG